MSKRMFYRLFKVAWNRAFTAKNIKSAFAKTGIWPFNPKIVMSIIRAPVQIVQEPAIQEVKTLLTCCAVRRAQQAYEAEPTRQNLELIFKATSRLATQSSIQMHKNLGLRQALQIEKKKRQRGKRLNLISEEESGAQIFTLSRVELARAYQASKEEEEQARKNEIAEKKAATAALQAQKAIELASRKAKQADAALQQNAARQIACEEQAQKAMERQTKKNALNALKAQKLAAKSLAKKPRKENLLISKPTESVAVPVSGVAQEERITLTIRGQLVKIPKKHGE